MTVGDRIAAWMKVKDVSPQQLAAGVGVTAAAVYQWLGTGKSKTMPSQESLEGVVEFLGLTMEAFYGRIPKPRAA